MASVVSTKRNNRGSNWEAEFYKNGYPKEIIVIEDTPPPDQTQSPSTYTVVPAPAPPLPISPTSNTRSKRRNDHDDAFIKRRRKHYAQPLNALDPGTLVFIIFRILALLTAPNFFDLIGQSYYSQAPLAAVAAAAAAAAPQWEVKKIRIYHR